MGRRSRKQNAEYAQEFRDAVSKSPEAGALALVGMTTMMRLTDKDGNGGVRNLGYAFKYALEQIKPHMEGGNFSADQQSAIDMAGDSLMSHIYSY